MQKTTIYLTSDMQQRLRMEAKRARTSQVELIREAVERYLASREAETLPQSIGAMDDAELTGANSEDWLRAHWRPR